MKGIKQVFRTSAEILSKNAWRARATNGASYEGARSIRDSVSRIVS
jgi:hypothetical protein